MYIPGIEIWVELSRSSTQSLTTYILFLFITIYTVTRKKLDQITQKNTIKQMILSEMHIRNLETNLYLI